MVSALGPFGCDAAETSLLDSWTPTGMLCPWGLSNISALCAEDSRNYDWATGWCHVISTESQFVILVLLFWLRSISRFIYFSIHASWVQCIHSHTLGKNKTKQVSWQNKKLIWTSCQLLWARFRKPQTSWGLRQVYLLTRHTGGGDQPSSVHVIEVCWSGKV